MLAVAAQLDLVPRLPAMVAAIFPVHPLGIDDALTRRVGALRRFLHDAPPTPRTVRPCAVPCNLCGPLASAVGWD